MVISVITIALIAFSLVLWTKTIIAAMIFLGIAALFLFIWTAIKISSLGKINRRIDVRRFVLLNSSPFLIAGAVGLSYLIEKGIFIPGIFVALLAMALLVMSLVKVFGRGKSDRMIDKQVIGLFIALVFIDFIVCIVLMLCAGLGHSTRAQMLLLWQWLSSFIGIVVCPLAAVILYRYYRSSSPENLLKAKSIILATVLTLFITGIFLIGRLGFWPLMVFAARNDNLGLERFLIHVGFNTNAKDRYDGWTPLMFAGSKGDIETARLLLEKGAANQPEAFIQASIKGQTGIMKLLLEKGADVNSQTPDFGVTALMFAARWARAYNSLGAMQFLIARGADVTAKDHSGKTVLMYACEGGHSGAVKLLIEQAYYKDVELSGCKDAFFDACFEGDLPLVRQFLERGMDVNARNDFHWTALMFAAAKGHTDIVEYLLAKGAEVNKSDFSGKTALGLAVEGGHSALRDMLLKYGAKQ